MDLKLIESIDPEIARAIEKEFLRQKYTLELIASENIASRAVMAVQASVLTNKYAEGYPGKRYYGGCECVDIAENLAIDRAKTLFDAEYANVQPHSGSQANMTVYFSALKPGDKALGMDLAHGGHLTHGNAVSFSGKFYQFAFYGLSEDTETIDYDQVERLAMEHQPKIIVAGASAYPRTIDFKRFSDIAQSVNALLMVDMAHIAGLVAAGVHPSPVPYADYVTSTTHKTLRGPRGGLILAKAEYAKGLNSNLFPGAQGGPLMHIIAAKAVAFKEALTESFKTYQQQIVANAGALAANLIDAGVKVVSGGTDNHLILLDLRNLNVTGKEAEDILGEANITVNKNAIPNDPQKRNITSGIRVGTPAITTRGMKETEMARIAELIVAALKNKTNGQKIQQIKAEVKQMCETFPMYQEPS